MKARAVLRRTREILSRLKRKTEPHGQEAFKSESNKPAEKNRLENGNPWSTAYRLIGERIEAVAPLFSDLDSNLQKSGIKIGFKPYVSLTVLATAIQAVTILILVPCLLFFAFALPLVPALLFGVGLSLFVIAFSTIGFYAFPIYRADKLRRDLEDELPFTVGYMAILVGAGVSPEKVFFSLSNLSAPLAISAEAKDVVRSVNLFGKDIISALEERSRVTPSERLREMLEGFIATIHSGSSSTAYLKEKSRQYMKLKRIGLKKFSDTLSVLSEFYVAILLTGPLLFIIMLSVMAMLGGGNMGLLSPDLLLGLLTYLGLPLGATAFLLVLDAVTPKW